MPYNPTRFVNGQAPAVSAEELNKMGEGIEDLYLMLGISNGIAQLDVNGNLKLTQRAPVQAGEDELISISSSSQTTNTTWTKMREFQVSRAGIYRFKFDLGQQYSSDTSYARSYVNGVPYGTIRQRSGSGTTSFIEDIPLKVGDRIAVWAYSVRSDGYCSITNAGLSIDKTEAVRLV